MSKDSNKKSQASMSDAQAAEHKRIFMVEVEKFCGDIEEKKNCRGGVMSKEKYDTIVSVLKTENEKMEKIHYKWRSNYAMITGVLGNTLLVKKSDAEKVSNQLGEVDATKVVRVCHREELYEILKKIHNDLTGHAGVDKTHRTALIYYSNVSRSICEIYVKSCPICSVTKRTLARPEDFKPILTAGFGRRGQCDLIDMQSHPDGQFLWILHYQDHALKFSILRPLTGKSADLVAFALFEIFCIIGAPLILHTDNGKEFTASVIVALQILWPSMQLINGRARHPQSQGSVEKGNQDIEKMILHWMNQTGNTRWSIGINIVQAQKNSRYHEALQNIPYRLVFGQDLNIGMAGLHLDEDMLAKINDIEQDLDPDMAAIINGSANLACEVEERLSPEGIQQSPFPTSSSSSMVCDAVASGASFVQAASSASSSVSPSLSSSASLPLSSFSSSSSSSSSTASATRIATPTPPAPMVNCSLTVGDEGRAHLQTQCEAALKTNTPGRKRTREAAFGGMIKQAYRMKKMAGGRNGRTDVKELSVGSVVLIKVDRVDKANVDPLCLPCVVLDKNEHDAYLVGCKGGVLKTRYFRGDLRFDSLKTPVSYGLDKILLDWKTIPRDQTISVREGMAAISPVGGQGHVHCGCKTTCTQNSCSCRKHGLLCNSRCHKSNNRNCLNCFPDDESNDDAEVD